MQNNIKINNDDIPMPKHTQTYILAWIHIIWIIVFMWIGVFFIPSKYRWIWLLIMCFEIIHWKFSKGECLLSYYEKRSEDPDYELGNNPELTYAWVILKNITGLSIKELRKIHAELTKIVFIYVLADQILLHNFFNIHDDYRVMIFMFALVLTFQYVSFDSFELLSNNNIYK